MIEQMDNSGIPNIKNSDDYKGLVEAQKKYDDVYNAQTGSDNKGGKDNVEVATACAAVIDKAFSTSLSTKELNGMGNMALLDEKTNKSYKNAPFFMKRMIIKDIVRGGGGVSRFIPPCTRNVFDKSYSDVVGNMLHWTQTDADSYKQAIKDTLWQYLGV